MDGRPIDLVASADVPLYRQLAEALRYRISSGALPAGERLPTLREGAERWGINLHTVRKAYHALQDAGLVEVERPLGTFVSLRAMPHGAPGRDATIRRFLTDLRERFSVGETEAVELVREIALHDAPPPPVHVLECSRTLSRSLADQIRRRLGGDVRSHELDVLPNVDPGKVVATHFHMNEVRASLADRASDLVFVSIAPSRTSVARAAAYARRVGAHAVLLCERDPVLGLAVATDLGAILAEQGLGVEFDVPDLPGQLLLSRLPRPVLFSPGSWDALPERHRTDPRAFLLDYRIRDDDLERLRDEVTARRDE